jgi:hypothetical protein
MVLNSHNFGRPVEVTTLLFRVRVCLAEEVYQVGEYFHSDRESLDGTVGIAGTLRRRHHHPIAPTAERFWLGG